MPVLIAHGRSLLPPHLVGRGMTLFNIGTMGGAFVVQLVSGALIDLFPAQDGVYPLDAYRLVFAAAGAGIVARGCAAYLTVRAATENASRPTAPCTDCRRGNHSSEGLRIFTEPPSCFLCGAVYIVAARYVICVTYPPPSLGVSSLDLGRLLASGPFSLPFRIDFVGSRDLRSADGRAVLELWAISSVA